MSLNSSRIRTHKAAIITVVIATAALTFGYFGGPAVRRVLAGRESAAAVRFAVPAAVPGSVSVETPRSPWIKLREGKAANSEFSGSPAAIARFQAGSLRPVSLASADVNGDGFPDLISGFSGPDGGVVTIQRGARQAFAPDDPQVLAGIRNGEFPASFEKDAFAVDVPGSPDYLFTGRFLRDSALDLAVATRGSQFVNVYPINEKGMIGSPVSIDLGGDLTAAAADTFDPAKGFTGLVAATGTEGAASLVIFDGTGGITETKGRSVAIAHPADSLILRSPDGLTADKDLFILGGGSVSRLPAIGKAGSGIENIDLPFNAVDFAAGEFIRDCRARTELAVLADNGSIYYLANGTLDRRPFTEDEMRAAFAKGGRGRAVVVNSTDTASALANNWTIAEQQDLGLVNLVRPNAQPLLRRAYITGNETDDLLVVDPSTNHAKILFKEPVYGPGRLAFTGDTQVEDLGFAFGIAAALPVRLNVMGQQGIAVLEDGKLEATPVLFAPQATFTVTKTADTADGVCNADCSLREAVVAANALSGADLVTVPAGTYTLTLAGANENSAATGDLDILQATTITGSGSANTIIQGGTSNANGIDKVLSINPTFTAAFATSITGVTVRWGRNPSSYATDGFGGGFDWEGSGTGTLSVANSTVTDNHTLDGDGGGITATNSTPGAGTFTVTNSTISNNSPARVGPTNSPVGGGIFVGTTTPYLITNTTITGNNVSGSGGQGQGGGLLAFGPGGAGGNSFLTGSTVSNNTAPSDAGGVYSTQRVDVNAPTAITGNSSGRFGGGLFLNHPNATSTITKATITGNSATTTGGGIYLGTSTSSNVLNLSYSRIVGNTGSGFTGLISAGGTANATNNWWGCNTGPAAAPCNTTGTATGGVATTTPFLQLRNTAATSPIVVGQTSALTASFLLNSAGSPISASNLDVLIGSTVNWGATLGTISGAQTTIQAAGTATATYTGTSAGSGTATATVDSGAAVANITVNPPSADLAITKTDGVTNVTAGGSTTYTITASNAGPSPATGPTVSDTFPASLTGTWTCVGAGGGTCTASGSGNINDTVNLPVGGSVTYTVSATISASATGTLSNTATVTAPGGVTDPTPGNNSATDTDTILRSADLAITKTDGVTTVTAGGSTTYTITASNAGPSNASGSTVADTFPASLTGTWTCVGAGGGTCTASGSGNINDTVNLPVGGSVTYTVSTTISAAATGSLSNTATVAAAAGVTDPTPGNNSATDTDTIAASADLAITKTDGVTNVLAGTATTYTISASNAGPSNAPGSTVADTFAASITSATWTCIGAGGGTCTASGSGNISDTVNLPAGGSVTYTVTANISAAATGSLVNTATVSAAGGVTDPTPGNNSATDTDTITPSDSVLPTAAATLTNVTGPGGTLYTFTVTYSDNVAVNVSTLDSNDIVVTGPNAFSTPATFVSVDTNTNGSPRVATYSFVPPGGTWDTADNGTYTVTMQASQVSDTNGNFVNGGSLGTFTAVPLVLVVDRTDDTVVSACTAAANDCTLRGAIAAANAASTADTINFDPAIFATPQTITLGGTEMVITNSGGLTINGPGADKLTINANGTSRVFTNSSGAVTTISGMRLTGGTGTGAAGTGRGGAVYNAGGTLTLNGLVIRFNTAPNGGGVNTAGNGTTNIFNCWIANNSVTGAGGAVQNFSGSTTNIVGSSITDNVANSSTTGGGGVQANGTVTITNTTIANNPAPNGSGGGIYYNGSALTITNSTIAYCAAQFNGGGIHSTSANPPNIRNSILAGNEGAVASPDATAIFASNGNNVIGNVGTSTGWVGSDLQNTDPLFAPMGFYGGNGYTVALTSSSPAINGGQDCVLTLTCSGPNPASAITLDQRGAARIGTVDIGSFELNNSTNGGNFVAQLPSATTGVFYNFDLTAVNNTFIQTVTAGSLPPNIVLNGNNGNLSGTPSLSGVYPFSVTATGGANSNVTDYRLTVFAPPGTLVSVGGRVTLPVGGGAKGVTVILTDSLNNSYSAGTSPMGYYRIDNVPAGATYTLSVSAKRYQYTPTNLAVNYNVTDNDLVVTPIP